MEGKQRHGRTISWIDRDCVHFIGIDSMMNGYQHTSYSYVESIQEERDNERLLTYLFTI